MITILFTSFMCGFTLGWLTNVWFNRTHTKLIDESRKLAWAMYREERSRSGKIGRAHV